MLHVLHVLQQVGGRVFSALILPSIWIRGCVTPAIDTRDDGVFEADITMISYVTMEKV